MKVDMILSDVGASVKQKHIAIIIPIAYSGGSLRGAKSLAETLLIGGRLCGTDIKITLAHLYDSVRYPDEVFADLHPDIARRTYQWKILDAAAARRAITYSGQVGWEPLASSYIVPDDGINQFLDCDLWLIISDRLSAPLLPIRPYALMVYDYIQRYIPFLSYDVVSAYLDAARQAHGVLVTTKFTAEDVMQYAGVPPDKVHQLPVLPPCFKPGFVPIAKPNDDPPYFIWTTNTGMHKNHVNSFKALQIYYDEFDGVLECHITGFNVDNLLNKSYAHLYEVSDIYYHSVNMKNFIKLFAELPDRVYQHKLQKAAYLWHSATIDNGTLSVVEASQLGVPALSSDYPPMREIDLQFNLNLAWMDASSPHDMAQQLKWMEEHYQLRKVDMINKQQESTCEHPESVAKRYWQVIQTWL